MEQEPVPADTQVSGCYAADPIVVELPADAPETVNAVNAAEDTTVSNPPATEAAPVKEQTDEAPSPPSPTPESPQKEEQTDEAPSPPSPTPESPQKEEKETKSSAPAGKGKYTLTALPLGAEVTGLQLADAVDEGSINQLKDDVHKHKVLIFRNQGELSGERQIQVTEWFGEIETAGFELHDKAPDRRILRVSNDESEGYLHFGTAGFHVDGSFMEKPNTHTVYHMVQAPSEGETYFVAWNDVLQGLCKSKKMLWRRLWMLKTFNRIRGYQEEPGQVVHPLVYKHPKTDEPTMCVSLGKMSRFYMDYKTPSEKQLDKEASEIYETDITNEIRRENDALLYKHQWQSGDVIITDNLAVGHLASEGTQKSRDEIGLRILHRTVTKGTYQPADGHLAAKNQKCVVM